MLCYDGSPSAAIAIAEAGRLLRTRPAVVCHVWAGVARTVLRADPSALPGALAEAAEELDKTDHEAAERLAADGVELASRAGLVASPLTRRRAHKTWRALLEAADAEDAALLVAGAHGLSGIERILLGSVSTALVVHSTRPVLVVPAGVTDHAAAGPVLLCYDGSPTARLAIEVAADLFAERRALVLNCWTSWAAETPGPARLSHAVRGMAAELDEIAATQSAATVAEGVSLAEQAGLDAEALTMRTEGPAWSGVREVARERDAAVIVMGSRGLSGLSRALGSVSSAVVHHSSCAVLVMPAPSG